MPESYSSPQPAQKSSIQFIACERCKGFGFEVTGNKQHLECKVCHAKPGLYGILNNQLLQWRVDISPQGNARRKMQRAVNMSLTILLMAGALLGLAALGYASFRYFNAGYITAFQDIIDFFTTPQFMLGVFWVGVVCAMMVYYRLDRDTASKKEFDYSSAELNREEKKRQKWPAHPTYEKYAKISPHLKVEMSQYVTQEAMNAVEQSVMIAQKLGHQQATPLHLMAALLDSVSVMTIMVRLGISKQTLIEKIGAAMAREGLESGREVGLGLETKQMIFYAYEEAYRKKRRHVDTMELAVAIAHMDPWVSEMLYDVGIDEQRLQNVVEWIHMQRALQQQYVQWKKKASTKPKGIMDRAMTAQQTRILDALGADYTVLARRGRFFPPIGRQEEMEQVMRVLLQNTGNVLLVGAPGVGKSTILEGIAQRMASEDMPPKWQDKRFVVMDPGSLIAGASGVGIIEARMLAVIRDIQRSGNILFGIEDVHHLLNMRSTTGSEDAGSILMNALSQGQLQVVATTTTEEYQKFIATKGTFLRRFQVVTLNELERDAAILVLEARAGEIEYKNKVFFSYAALEAAVDLSVQFIQDRYLPAKALDIMGEAATLAAGSRGEQTLVTKEDVAQVISQRANVQVTAITDDERDKLLNLEDIMHQRIVGQDEAVQAIASALRRAREGLRDAGRPIANLLFLGPTGVGKTETAKTIAEVYFGNEEQMIRLDMSEYQEVSALGKLIGSKGEQGVLTEAVRLKPFSIVLLDEFEKAHPDVLNIFLQIMDDGRVTDGLGRVTDMSSCMIIATSNAATQQIQNAVKAGLPVEQLKTRLMEEVLPQVFAPELINRFDNIVVFKPLTIEEVTKVAERMLDALGKQLHTERGITLEVVPAALTELASRGYDPLYGARPLRRVIQDTVNDGLAKLFLQGGVGRRDTVVLLPGGEFQVKQADRL